MAEFTEVMRQAKRICTVHGGICSYRCCPLADGQKCRLNVNLDGEDYNELERIIMDWTRKHPEPVYPSWEEGWKQPFPEADIRNTLCPEVFGDKYKCDWCHDYNDNCDECLERPMPAEVAEKLGVKPIDHQSDDVHNGCVGCKYAKRSVVEAPCAQCGGWKMITPDTNRRGDLWEAEK